MQAPSLAHSYIVSITAHCSLGVIGAGRAEERRAKEKEKEKKKKLPERGCCVLFFIIIKNEGQVAGTKRASKNEAAWECSSVYGYHRDK